VSYLRLIANEDDDPAFIRAATTPKRASATLHWSASANMPARIICHCLPQHLRAIFKKKSATNSWKTCSPFANTSTNCKTALYATLPVTC